MKVKAAVAHKACAPLDDLITHKLALADINK